MVARGRRLRGGGGWEGTTKGYGASVWRDENVLKLLVVVLA